jgi:hypothetical protein
MEIILQLFFNCKRYLKIHGANRGIFISVIKEKQKTPLPPMNNFLMVNKNKIAIYFILSIMFKIFTYLSLPTRQYIINLWISRLKLELIVNLGCELRKLK